MRRPALKPQAVIARKALVLAEIAEMIKQNGEEKVLY